MWNTPMYNTTKLTVELRDIVDNGENSVDIWDFEYPSYYKDEAKTAFERKVINHYYFRQIGQETVGRWLHMFRTRMQEIMPYYIDMYKTVEIMHGIDDPFGNLDVTETFEEEHTGKSSGESSGSDKGSSNITQDDSSSTNTNREHRFTNTPQGSISNIDNYLTEATKDTESVSGSSKNTSSSTSSGSNEASVSSSSSGTVKHTLTRKGNHGVNTYAHDMIEFRQSIIDVDMMVINSLQDLFLQVY